MTDEEIKNVIDSLTVLTNDAGEQDAIDLQSLNLCDPDNTADYSMPYPYLPSTTGEIQRIIDGADISALINSDVNDIINSLSGLDASSSELLAETTGGDGSSAIESVPTGNRVIIEFGDDYTLGEAVEYTLAVTPGQTVDASTIMGSVVQGGKQLPIRSIFNKATVVETEQHDFFRLFPTAHADRHILLDNVEYGTGCDFKYADVENIQQKFQIAACTYNFIVNNMCLATLPNILINRESYKDHHIWTLAGYIPNPLHLAFDGDADSKKQPTCTNGQKRYEIYINGYADELQEKLKWSVEPGSAENIKATNGNSSKMNDLLSEMESRRDEVIEWTKEKYNQSFQLGACRYDEDYSDCRFLATGVDISCNLISQDFSNTKIGYTVYSNYYLDLLSKLTLSDNDPWTGKYYKLLTEIIQNRMSAEKYSRAYLISEFNQLFQTNFMMDIEDPFSLINNDLGNSECTYTDVQQWFSKLVTVGYADAEGNVNAIESQHTGTPASEDQTLVQASTQLANIYWFIKNLPSEMDSESLAQNSESVDVLKMVQSEQQKLYNFWLEACASYEQNNIQSATEEFNQYVAGLTQYAEWPSGMPINIGGATYTLYEFQNPFITPDASAADEAFDVADFEEPELQETSDLDPNTLLDQEINDDNDPKADEPTPKDYEYWVRYFSLATVISVASIADGLDIPNMSLSPITSITMNFMPIVVPPGGLIPIPLPCIYVCVGCVYIKQLSMALVFGLGIRGIYIYPIVLVVNLSSHPLSFMTPLVAILEQVHQLFSTKIEMLEMLVPNLLQLIINKLEAENASYRKKNDEYMVYTEVLKAQRITNKGMLKKKLQELYNNGPITQVYTRTQDLVNSASDTYNDVTSKLTTTNDSSTSDEADVE